MGLSFEFALSSLKSIEAERANLEAEVAELRKPWGMFQSFEKMSHTATNGDPLRDYDWPKFEAAIVEDRARDERNKPIADANAVLMKKLVDTISATGVGSTGSKWNGRKRSYEKVDAEWTSLLRSNLHARPSLSFSEDAHKRNIEKRKAAQEATAKAARDAERKQTEAVEARRAMAILVDVANSLGMPVTSSKEELQDAIRGKDKYIDLAAGGESVRNDWSDGPDAAESALARFQIVSETDIAIAEDWGEIVSSFEDGRSFRDCKWNYSAVFALASPALLELWNKLSEVPDA